MNNTSHGNLHESTERVHVVLRASGVEQPDVFSKTVQGQINREVEQEKQSEPRLHKIKTNNQHKSRKHDDLDFKTASVQATKTSCTVMRRIESAQTTFRVFGLFF